MRKHLFSLVLAAAICCAASAAPFDNVAPAGTPSQQVHLSTDLDGDHTKDDIYFVKVTGPIPSSVKVIHLFSDQPKTVAKGELALAVVLHPGGKPVNYFLSFGPDMFKSPTWSKGDYRNLIKLGHGPQKPKDAKGLSIGVFTESGALEYVRWDGKTFVVTGEGDEP